MLVIGGLFWWEPVLIRLLPLVLHVTVLSGPKPGAAAKPELWMIVEQEMSRAREGWGQTCEEKRGHDPTIFSKHSQTGQQPPKSGHCKSWGGWSSSRRSGCGTLWPELYKAGRRMLTPAPSSGSWEPSHGNERHDSSLLSSRTRRAKKSLEH